MTPMRNGSRKKTVLSVIATYKKEETREQETEAYDSMTSMQFEKDWSKKKNVRSLNFFSLETRDKRTRKRKNGLEKEMSWNGKKMTSCHSFSGGGKWLFTDKKQSAFFSDGLRWTRTVLTVDSNGQKRNTEGRLYECNERWKREKKDAVSQSQTSCYDSVEAFSVSESLEMYFVMLMKTKSRKTRTESKWDDPHIREKRKLTVSVRRKKEKERKEMTTTMMKMSKGFKQRKFISILEEKREVEEKASLWLKTGREYKKRKTRKETRRCTEMKKDQVCNF